MAAVRHSPVMASTNASQYSWIPQIQKIEYIRTVPAEPAQTANETNRYVFGDNLKQSTKPLQNDPASTCAMRQYAQVRERRIGNTGMPSLEQRIVSTQRAVATTWTPARGTPHSARMDVKPVAKIDKVHSELTRAVGKTSIPGTRSDIRQEGRRDANGPRQSDPMKERRSTSSTRDTPSPLKRVTGLRARGSSMTDKAPPSAARRAREVQEHTTSRHPCLHSRRTTSSPLQASISHDEKTGRAVFTPNTQPSRPRLQQIDLEKLTLAPPVPPSPRSYTPSTASSSLHQGHDLEPRSCWEDDDDEDDEKAGLMSGLRSSIDYARRFGRRISLGNGRGDQGEKQAGRQRSWSKAEGSAKLERSMLCGCSATAD
ncbi:MAG: hypothetical protein M1828_005589 [Chrysothrix sp. TS-e1954]|nr:MAG: hypothetical protein M1828_005589 [Chrysothrix sp. TS-e1954]